MVHEGTTDGMQDCKVKATFSQNRTTSERDKRKAKSKGGAASDDESFIIPTHLLKTLLKATMVTLAAKFIEWSGLACRTQVVATMVY
ncbi:hypothetical protein HanXRQr2_Chr01g0032841 [Helianthus annuus]|uniref:Uncharacterized protein n=1 Tax=Helianthus annuus TaxID=4232 RepID=A0A9K3JXG5_HELAN|nr:hypothetical protein HanXRQr2_Chr01g0032841 [Helianthus annuus]KAJ0612362.1 hypothetical protein HanHA300_Chr01g0026661 [Helianthus annuus]KAJ0627710.1 hypothetical protein HanHA89_Chr01g0028821 [Helianthus annuus]KAJ0784001.1 hypothetical protein HanLR1_Chr01g0027291 [Helianthus annuus]KAJ0957810.1 hypothetical protein HanPSC8_Chr01g0031971 [Helianthus annuus]